MTDPHKRWTQGDITTLRAGVGGGEPLESLAERLQRAPTEVTTMMERLRLRF